MNFKRFEEQSFVELFSTIISFKTVIEKERSHNILTFTRTKNILIENELVMKAFSVDPASTNLRPHYIRHNHENNLGMATDKANMVTTVTGKMFLLNVTYYSTTVCPLA